MKTVHDQLRENILTRAGIIKHKKIPSLDNLKETEWNKDFEQLMRNRLVLGRFRYGALCDNISYDWITSIRQRLDLIEHDGNGEHLVDIANICLVAFTRKDHPKFHFKASDDGIHTKKK